MSKVPVSLIIDDPAPIISVYHEQKITLFFDIFPTKKRGSRYPLRTVNLSFLLKNNGN